MTRFDWKTIQHAEHDGIDDVPEREEVTVGSG